MARCTMKMPEKFLLKISRLGNKTDDVCGRVLNAGAEVVLKKVRTNLRNVISKDTKTQSRSTGERERSLGVSPVLSVIRGMNCHGARIALRSASAGRLRTACATRAAAARCVHLQHPT